MFIFRTAELYPAEDPKPVFTTTIVFNSQNAAEKVKKIIKMNNIHITFLL